MSRRGLKKAIAGNWLDQTIMKIAPTWGVKRMESRARSYVAAHGFSAADRGRGAIEGWTWSSGDADQDILNDLPTLRNESRDLHRNSGLASAIFNTKNTAVIGSGLKPHPQIDFQYLGLTEEKAKEIQDTIKREWPLFAKYCNIDGESNFGETCALAYGSMLESGDVFGLTPFDDSDPRTPYARKIQLVEADMVSTPYDQADNDAISGGIEVDPDTGRRLAAHFCSVHPGNLASGRERRWRREEFYSQSGLPRVLHLTKKKRIGQRRGIPELAPVIELIKQLTRFTEAEVAAAVVTSFFTVFVTSENGEGIDPLVHDGGNSGENTDRKLKLGYGNSFDLAPDEDIKFADPNRPNKSYNDFAMSLVTQICAALEIPAEIVLKSFTKSYTASRAAITEAWKLYVKDRNLVAEKICAPMYELFFEEAVSLGRIPAVGFAGGDPAIRQAWLKVRWIGPPKGMIDEVKEIEGAERRTEGGFTTLEEESETLFGSEWEPTQRQRAREVDLRRELGLELNLDQISEFRR